MGALRPTPGPPMSCKHFFELARSWVHFLHFLSCPLKPGCEKTQHQVVLTLKWESASGAGPVQLGQMEPSICSTLTVSRYITGLRVMKFSCLHIPFCCLCFSPSFFCLCPHPPSDICCDNTASRQKRLLCSFIVPFILVLL